jgi:DNA invertase Pin-like site-specific DNA recombinase
MIGYLRVSTSEQATNGHGLGAQRAAIESEALRRGWDIEWIEDGGCSGGSMVRPGLANALRRLHDGDADGLVVSKLDRLSRSVVDFANIVKRAEREGWTLVVLDPALDLSTPMGRAMAGIAVVFAQLEREMASDRTKAGLAVARAKGKRLGGARGVSKGSPTRLDPLVQRRILRERAGGHTLAEIAHGLNADEVPTALRGKLWHAKTIANIVRRAGRIQRDPPPAHPSAWAEGVIDHVERLLDEREHPTEG